MALVTAAALVVLLQLTAAAAAAADGAPPIWRPGCITSCGNVSVPYPFGIQPGCYRQGFNLTCDTSRPGSPRLLLGDGSLRVVDIFIENATVRVLRDGPMLNASGGGPLSIEFASFFAGGHYRVSYRNELILFGCNVEAELVAGKIRPAGGSTPRVQLCNSICVGYASHENKQYCDGTTSCCQSHYSSYDWYHMPTELRLRPHEAKNDLGQDVMLFVAELDWFDNWTQDPTNVILPDPKNDIPLMLRWDIMQGLAISKSDENRSPYNSSEEECPHDVANLCKGNKSECTYDTEVYWCSCKKGYEGNPYVDGGCQDIDECKHPQGVIRCFGECTNTDGSFECRCPSGTFGNPVIPDGCFETADSSKDWPLQMPGMAPLRVGLPQCETSCGHVHVPYPFGFGPNRCYLPGFKLTCDKGHKPPRLFLGSSSNNTLQVVGIFLNDSTVRVIHRNSLHSYDLIFPDIGEPYMLSARNEFIFFGCDMAAELHGEYGNSTVGIISRCVSTCSTSSRIKDSVAGPALHSTKNGCCHADIPPGSRPDNVAMWEISNVSSDPLSLALAFVAEKGQIDQWSKIFNKSDAYYFTRIDYSMTLAQYHEARDRRVSEVPLVLQWELKQNVSPSAQSDCWRKNGGYTCYCKNGFYGNPYLVDGCHDIDECKISENLNKCFGDCKNLYGSYECRCPRGTYGDAYKRGGCTKYLAGIYMHHPARMLIHARPASDCRLAPLTNVR